MRKPRPQEVYRHFKGRLYQIVTICKHSETGEEMVVYQAMYGDFAIYCRPLWMFMEALDPSQYPDAPQSHRFQLMKPMSETIRERPERPPVPGVLRDGRREEDSAAEAERAQEKTTHVPEENPEEDEPKAPSGVMGKTIDEEAEELNLDRRVVAFLDADSTDERLKILDDLRMNITDEQIDICAMALDMNIPQGSVEDRFYSLRDLLLTRQRFESNRLREGKNRRRDHD